jgi:Zn-dependent protease
VADFFAAVMLINIILGLFNLIPIPPLDGSHVLGSLLPREALPAYYSFQRYGIIVLFAFLFFFGQYFWSIVSPVLNFFSQLAFGK